MTKTPSSRAQDREISVWFEKIQNGDIKLPRFQRPQAWDKGKIGSLLETIINNLPVGVALILEVGDSEQFVSRYLVTAPETGNRVVEHLLDGQQRLTALWRCLHNNYSAEKYFIYFKEFDRYYKEKGEKDIEIYSQTRWVKKNTGNMMPLWADTPHDTFSRGMIPLDLFRPGDIATKYEKWVETAVAYKRPEENADEFAEKFMEWSNLKDSIIKIIRDYRETIAHFNLPYLALNNTTSKDTALQVFINMNTNSKPLSQYDIVRAEIEGASGKSLDDLQSALDNDHPNLKHLWDLPFLILASSALMQNKLPNQRGMWDMDKDLMIKNWSQMSTGLGKMVDFMEGEGVYDRARLPTNSVLSVIAALFTHIPDTLDARGTSTILLKRFLWLAFFTDRYENSAATHAYNDYIGLRRIINSEVNSDTGNPYTEDDVPIFNSELHPIATEDELMRVGWPKRENIRARGILAVFSKLGAIDFADGQHLSRQQLIEGKRHYHHVFPDALISETDSISYLAMNCALITDKTNLNISNKDPMRYLKERYDWADEDLVQHRLKSHLIPVQELKNGGYEGLEGEFRINKIKQDYDNFLFKRTLYVHRAVKQLVAGRDANANDIINEVESL